MRPGFDVHLTRRLAGSRAWLRRLSVIGALGLAASCGKKSSPPSGPVPEVTGLAAVPATAEAVVGIDVAKVADAPIIDRITDQLLLRNPVLSERWQHVKSDCKIAIGKQVKRLMLAIGPHAGAEKAPAGAQAMPGTGPVIMVVVGAIPEADLKDCVTRLVGGGGGGGGGVTGKPAFGHTLYVARDGNRTMYFAYGRPDTIVLGSDEAYVTEALGTGKKAADNPELARWLALVNQNAALWAVGRTDARVRDGLVRLTEGKIAAGPLALTLVADLSSGASLDLGAVMARPEDANHLESYMKGELALLTAAAQWKSLGPVVGKIKVMVERDVVHFRAPLAIEDLNLLLSALDGGGPPAQDSAPPPAGAGAAGATGSGTPGASEPERPGQPGSNHRNE